LICRRGASTRSRAERLHGRWTKGHPGDTRASRLPLLSGEGVVRAIALVGGTSEEDQAVAEGGALTAWAD
jgi:hypothetical protein